MSVRRAKGVAPILWLLVGWIGLPTTALYGQDEGHKKTEDLLKRIGSTVKEMGEAQRQVQKSLEAYSTMLQGEDGDRRSAYKSLVKRIDRSEEKSKDVRKRSEEMQKEAKQFFKRWSRNLRSIKNDVLRRRSERRLEDSRDRFRELVEAEQKARGQFARVIGDLRDQVAYLGYDLNPDAAASLEEDATKLHQMASQLFEEIDAFTAIANEYIASLEPE